MPRIDVKLIRASGRTHFCRVLAPVPPREDERTWYQTLAHNETHQPIGDALTGIAEYAMTREDQAA